ncbi:hypothetical protein BaRGS_00004713, partial [Batillaria attramentaria]
SRGGLMVSRVRGPWPLRKRALDFPKPSPLIPISVPRTQHTECQFSLHSSPSDQFGSQLPTRTVCGVVQSLPPLVPNRPVGPARHPPSLCVAVPLFKFSVGSPLPLMRPGLTNCWCKKVPLEARVHPSSSQSKCLASFIPDEIDVSVSCPPLDGKNTFDRDPCGQVNCHKMPRKTAKPSKNVAAASAANPKSSAASNNNNNDKETHKTLSLDRSAAGDLSLSLPHVPRSTGSPHCNFVVHEVNTREIDVRARGRWIREVAVRNTAVSSPPRVTSPLFCRSILTGLRSCPWPLGRARTCKLRRRASSVFGAVEREEEGVYFEVTSHPLSRSLAHAVSPLYLHVHTSAGVQESLSSADSDMSTETSPSANADSAAPSTDSAKDSVFGDHQSSANGAMAATTQPPEVPDGACSLSPRNAATPSKSPTPDKVVESKGHPERKRRASNESEDSYNGSYTIGPRHYRSLDTA